MSEREVIKVEDGELRLIVDVSMQPRLRLYVNDAIVADAQFPFTVPCILPPDMRVRAKRLIAICSSELNSRRDA